MDGETPDTQDETFDSSEVGLVRRNPWILALAASPFLLSLAALIGAITGRVEFLAVAFQPLVLGAVALAFAWNRNPRARTRAAKVHADGRGVTIDGGELVPRSRIREGFVLPRPGRQPIVRLVRRGLAPALEVEVRDEHEGRRMLRALGLDASQTIATFRVSSRAIAHRAWSGAIVGAFVGLAFLGRVALASHAGAFASLMPFFVIAMLVLFLVPSSLRVGVDGMLLTWFGTKRFISYADVELVSEYTEGVGRSRVHGASLLLRSGEYVKVPVSSTTWDGGRVGIVVERIREAMETYHRGGAEADAALLRRGDRSVRDWLTALRAIGTGANAAHRTAPVAPERLWRIVEDPGGEPLARAAAAVALGAALDDDGRSRLRVAAEATAAPKLRVALEAARAGEDEALSQAIAELEEAPSERGARRAGA